MPAAEPSRLSAVARALEERFIGKDETIRLLLIALVAGEHAVLVGPPGTAKSALVRTLARLVEARYFEYLLTRFTEPNEIFGPLDIQAFRSGEYARRTAGMLPEAEILFLHEVFKSNSAILNALLTLLNERTFAIGGRVHRCPLVSVFAASNEVPTDDALAAVFDRFLLRIRSADLDAYHFGELVLRGVANEVAQSNDAPLAPLVKLADLADFRRSLGARLALDDAFLGTYKAIVFQIRAEGVKLSDRRVVKLLKLFAASAYLDGRARPDASDLFLLKHVWNDEGQAALLEAIVQPVLEAFHREHPDRRRVGALGVGVEALAGEIERIRLVLAGAAPLGDVQLFSQLKALGEIRGALAAVPDERARELERRVHDLLEATFKTGRFAGL